MANLTLAISLIRCTKCDRSESDDTADLACSKKKACLDPLLVGSGDNIGDQGRADYRTGRQRLGSKLIKSKKPTLARPHLAPSWPQRVHRAAERQRQV